VRTVRQKRGRFAEDVAVHWLVAQRWRVVARNVSVGKDEIDIIAFDPGSTDVVVCVEVRSARSNKFGTPEERVDARKVGHLYRAARALMTSEKAHGLGVGGQTVRVDLLVVDLRAGRPEVRHLKAVEPA
jgi:putative endonuclease